MIRHFPLWRNFTYSSSGTTCATCFWRFRLAINRQTKVHSETSTYTHCELSTICDAAGKGSPAAPTSIVYCPTNKVTTVVYMDNSWKRLYSKVPKGWYEACEIKTATTTSQPNCTYTMIIDKNNNTFFRTYLISWVLWKCYAKNGQDSFFYQPHHFPPTYTQRVHPGKYK